MTGKKAAYLDRDGIIDELVYYPEQGVIDSPFVPARFRLVEGVGDLLRALRGSGYKLVVVSNQPGVAKGNFTVETHKKIQAKMRRLLEAEGVTLDAEYYCFHHPQGKVAKYRVECNCRKPKPGMLLKAAEELGLDLSRSVMIGDSVTDVVAGAKAGCKTVLVTNFNAAVSRMMAEQGVEPTYIARNVKEVADIFKKRRTEIFGR